MVQRKFMQTNWKVYCPLQTTIFYVQRGAAFIHHFDLGNIRQPGGCADTKFQIEAPLNEKMDMRSTVHRAFFLGIFPKITTFMATFHGQSVRWSSRLVISFNGAI